MYRARVISVEGSNVTVLCIDYGYTRTLPMKNIYKLKQVRSWWDTADEYFVNLSAPTVGSDRLIDCLTN